MTHELRDALRQGLQQSDEFFIAQVSGQLESRKVIGGPATMLRQLAMEPVAKDPQALANPTFSKWHGSCSAQREIKGPAHPMNPKFLGQSSHCREHRKCQVRMLVSVEMEWRNTRGQNLLDLCPQFIVRTNASRREPGEKLRYTPRQRIAIPQQRLAPDQDEMAADVKRGVFSGELDRVLESRAIRH